MKQMSIKMKVTLWYTLFMSLLAIIVLGILISLSSSKVLNSVQGHLKQQVFGSFAEIEWDRGKSRLDIDDDLEYFKDGIYLVIYDSQGYLVSGLVPRDFPEGIVLSPDKTEKVYSVRSGTGENFYVCDYMIQVPGYGNLWIRGIASQTEAENAIQMIVRLSLILFPVMILFIALGGYYITKKAFAPIRKMTETAGEISRGSDLSKRISLGEGRDEVYLLANTFDQMLSRLERQFEKEKQFTSDVSHELRTPISVILSQCEYGLREETSTEDKNKALDVIMNQSQKMARLIAQLLTLSRADSGKEALHLELVNISELLDMVVQEQKERAQEKNIIFHDKIQPDVLVRADETLLMRFFINLVSNAVTYGKNGGFVETSLWVKDNYIEGYIKDDGIGISADSLEKIWDRFYQVDMARTADKESGAGLGLPMVKWIAQAHGGEVRVESNPEEGSTFYFSFPKKN